MKILRRTAAVTLMAWGLLLATPAIGAHPPEVIATIGGFATPMVTVRPGENVTFRSTDINHNFSTVAGLCDSASETPAGCNASTPGLLQASMIRLHENAPPGTYDFYCNIYPLWMKGQLTVVP